MSRNKHKIILRKPICNAYLRNKYFFAADSSEIRCFYIFLVHCRRQLAAKIFFSRNCNEFGTKKYLFHEFALKLTQTKVLLCIVVEFSASKYFFALNAKKTQHTIVKALYKYSYFYNKINNKPSFLNQ